MKTKLIFSPMVARKLLKMGHVVVDIKPHRENENQSIFVFEDTEMFRKNLSIIKR